MVVEEVAPLIPRFWQPPVQGAFPIDDAPQANGVLHPRVAEFFAGIGLVRMALEQAGCRVVFANDISATKRDIYAANFDAAVFRPGDVRDVVGADIPDIDIATASFPCTDLSLAGNRAGLADGEESSLLSQFLRVLDEMDGRRPTAVLLENVPGFASSNGGEDLRATVERLNKLGYICDLLTLDARRFVPQSRARLFLVGLPPGLVAASQWEPSPVRPAWVFSLARAYADLSLQAAPLPSLPPPTPLTLEHVLDHYELEDAIWWGPERLDAFVSSLSHINTVRLATLRQGTRLTHAAAYRRTRKSRPVWEIRADHISGCLRTARGGSSKQAVVEAGNGQVRVRWMTAREYARLQGAPDFQLAGVSESQAKFALGDAVCVPAVAWLARHYLVRALAGAFAAGQAEALVYA